MLGPPLHRITIGLVSHGGTVVRKIPRVNIIASAYGISGTILKSIRSNPVVGP
jgi:hypothetical protein